MVGCLMVVIFFMSFFAIWMFSWLLIHWVEIIAIVIFILTIKKLLK